MRIQLSFCNNEEKELCAYKLDVENRLYGLTTKHLRGLAYQLANKNNKPHSFNNLKKESNSKVFKERHKIVYETT